MSLLHVLASRFDSKAYIFTVAHFDHGIRENSSEDRKLVQKHAKQYGLPFVYETGQLSTHASEEEARDARYAFLRSVMRTTDAQAILTAHHKDDALETVIFNMLRGTGRQGLVPFTSQVDIHRPLVAYTKNEIYAYAKKHTLQWREDQTNLDSSFSRNYIRNHLLPSLSIQDLKALKGYIAAVNEASQAINGTLNELLDDQPDVGLLNRYFFISLPHVVAKEVLTNWLRRQGVRSFDRKGIERLTIAVKTAASETRHDIISGYALSLTLEDATIIPTSEKKSPKK